MTASSKKLIALGVGTLLVVGVVGVILAKRHDKRLTVATSIAVATVQSHVSAATGLARGIRLPFYENDAKQPSSVMLGRTATPVDGGRYLVSDLRVESYTHGVLGTATNFVIEAPKCLIDPARKLASSDGRIVVSRTDGSFLMTGTGFEWRQSDSFLTISNEIATHMTSEGFKPPKPTNP